MTLDEARLLANVNARAEHLFEDGYRARWWDRNTLEVRNGKGQTYPVDTAAGTCACPFFQAHSGRHPCKHLIGWPRLLARQRDCRILILLTLLRAWENLDDAAGADDECSQEDNKVKGFIRCGDWPGP